MKPQARIQALIELQEKIAENDRIPMDGVVGDYMRPRRYIGSKDRSFIAENTYEIMRHKARLDWWLERQGLAQDDQRARVLVYLVLCLAHEPKRLRDLCDGSKHSPEPLSDAELALVEVLQGKDIHAPEMPLEICVECPPLYEDKLKAYFGDAFEDEMRAMMGGATLDMRVNTHLCDAKKARDYLDAGGVKTEELPYAANGLRAIGKAYLAKTKAFAKGWVEIQDEGSQLIAQMAGVEPGQQVLDYCAGAGGKTLALAAQMQGKGRIVAMDIDERRLNKGRERYKKARVSDMIEVRCLSDEKQRKWIKRQKEKFDVVLCDVPCTGTGTWRRNPDMRWRVFGPSLEELVEIQQDILSRVAGIVKPGGKLVYATCSLLPDENEAQVDAFLAQHPEFSVQVIDDALGLGSPYMRLTPHRHKTDGFFTAVLVKASAV